MPARATANAALIFIGVTVGQIKQQIPRLLGMTKSRA
jgi:hypothetical protein